jgi:hypothetical protein
MPAGFTSNVPAVPLIVHDPFFSVWSRAGKLTDVATTHWTGKRQHMFGMLLIDGKPHRFMGADPRNLGSVPPMDQTSREITPLTTVFHFAAGGVDLTLSFTSPLLPDDLELLGRPVTYLDLAVASTDGREHSVNAYLDFDSEWATGEAETEVVWGRQRMGDVEAMFVGAAAQAPLSETGDETQIKWGYFYVSSEPGTPVHSAFGDSLSLRRQFIANGTMDNSDDVRDGRSLRMPATAQGRRIVLSRDFGKIGALSEWRTLLAYDQVWAASYFDRRLRPYWSRFGQSAIGLIATAWAERTDVLAKVDAFDTKLIDDLRKSGGDLYARIGALAVRQCLGAHGLAADFNGDLLHFSKENSSNGSMATVDVTYPAAPFFLHFNPALLEAQIRPVLEYAASGRWPFPYAPHDVGRYPLANGQNYGGGDRTEDDQLPVEECGNMLILVAALARKTNDGKLAEKYWDTLKGWADYLLENGLDPANQLCTDDFAGHMPHNANLAIKAIIGIGGFGQLCERLGKADLAQSYLDTARDWALRWQQMAADSHGAFRLAFDQEGSWSQKYNLVWDRILDLNLFDSSVAEREMRHYRQKLNRYGLPLDSRRAYTKLDWIFWTACLTGKRSDFDTLIAPLGAWLDDTPARVPLSDWFETDTGTQPYDHGFFARSVVGGILIKLLVDGL